MEKLRVDVLATGETTWANNALEFDTKDAALAYARDLYSRWMLADKFRVVLVSTPQREAYVSGSEDQI